MPEDNLLDPSWVILHIMVSTTTLLNNFSNWIVTACPKCHKRVKSLQSSYLKKNLNKEELEQFRTDNKGNFKVND